MSRAPSRYAGPFLLVIALSGLLPCGCAHAPALKEDAAFRAADPHSILILPVVNRSAKQAANEAFGKPGAGLPPGPYHADYLKGRK